MVQSGSAMIKEALTFKDVLLVPQRSPIKSRGDVNTDGRFTRRIRLHRPLVSANMDTVTEAEMAIAMARLGGLGIIHRFLSIEAEAAEVARVKRAQSFVIENPYTLSPDHTVADAIEMMRERRVGGLIVVDVNNKVKGIITRRDVQFVTKTNVAVSKHMTKKVITAKPGIGADTARRLFQTHKIEKLPLINKSGVLRGLITSQDVIEHRAHPETSLDKKGRLLVGAAVGVVGDFVERAEELHDAGADVLVVDVAHGHADHVISAVKKIKAARPAVEIVAGNVATYEGARDLVRAGADGIKVGVGPGATCSTRVVTGSGVPQLTAVQDAARITRGSNVPICADGGIRDSGDLTKAFAAGASSVMAGSLFAGTDESPGWTIVRGGMKYKVYRGMASLGATMGRRKAEQNESGELSEVVPEGVESTVPYRGSVSEVLYQLMGGLRSGMSYSGAKDLKSFAKKAKFVRITQAGWLESKPAKGLLEG
jgi:IMP dehydrogenase